MRERGPEGADFADACVFWQKLGQDTRGPAAAGQFGVEGREPARDAGKLDAREFPNTPGEAVMQNVREGR